MKRKNTRGTIRVLCTVSALAAVFFLAGAACSLDEPGSASLVNPGFESGDDTGWTLGGGSDIITLTPHSGSYCLRLPVVPDDGAYAEQSFSIIMGKYDWLDYSLYTRRAGTGYNGIIGMKLDFYNAADQFIDGGNSAWSCNTEFARHAGGTVLPAGPVVNPYHSRGNRQGSDTGLQQDKRLTGQR